MPANVSVALCTADGAAFIEQQVASIVAQTAPVAEIVLADDASTDDSVSRATAVAEDAGVPLTVLRTQRALGVTANFERAILACRSEFVALSDQDDVWHPDRIAQGLRAFAASPRLSLVSSDADLVGADGSRLGLRLFEALEIAAAELDAIAHGRGFEELMRRNLVTGATTILRRDLAVAAAPFPVGWVHDEWLAIVAAARDEIGVVDAPLIDYRQHEANQIGARKLGLLGKARRMLEPGAERNARLLLRSAGLATRLAAIDGVPAERVVNAVQKHEHERVRSSLSPWRLRRVRPVLAELRTGRYAEFGRGGLDAARDLLQPLRGSG